METMVIHPQNKEQLKVLKAVAKALKVDFETHKDAYDPAFVEKIIKSKKQAENGEVVSYTIEQLEDLCK